MIIAYKIRIYPNKTQIQKCEKLFGCSRFVCNHYIAYNKTRYGNIKKCIPWRKYRDNELKELRKEFPWLEDVDQHSLAYSLKYVNEAYKKFFNGTSGYPKFKSKKNFRQSFYLDGGDKVKFNGKHVKLLYLGKVRITEPDYVPKGKHIKGVTVKKELDKYYASFRIDMDEKELDDSSYTHNFYDYGYGIDVGVKTFITLTDSNEELFYFSSFLNDKRILKLEEKIKKLQKVISNKMEINYQKILDEYLLSHDISELTEKMKNIMKGESYSNKCRQVQKKISRLRRRITNIKKDIINKIVIKMTKLKPEFITIETLDIREMLENDYSTTLHKHIQDSMFRYFFNKLKFKSKIYNIELRQAFKYFASSKTCYICGHKKKDLKLSDRLYVCKECGNIVDRDVNSALNLVKLKKYIVI